MLNLNNSKTQDLKTNRIEELLGTITDARKSLQDWQDKRTEALIQLDALSYDLRKIEEEKKRNAELIEALKNEIEDRAKVYQSHVESITDQMQMLKVEKEEAEIKLNEAIDRLQTSLDNSELERNRLTESSKERENEIVSTWERRLAEQRTDFEIKISDQFNRNRNQVEELNNEINILLEKIEILKAQNAESEIRADRNDRELSVIRSQMMNVLKVTEGEKLSDFFKPAATMPSNQADATGGYNATTAPRSAEVKKYYENRSPNPNIVTNAEALALAGQGKDQNGNVVIQGGAQETIGSNAVSRAAAATSKAANTEKTSTGFASEGGVAASMSEGSTVEDYLKRLGY
ncbi:MAG: hypothetical protein JST80_05020 [Bdellovibrionales bacterium]|nr:hypothetical protein [Bdellovibrionales bacterium]